MRFLKTFFKSLREMLSRRFFQIVWTLSVLILGLSVGVIFWQLFPEATQQLGIPLHYNVHSGVDLFGDWRRIFMVPTFGAVILVLNTVISIALWKKEHVLSYLFSSVMLAAQVILFIAMIFIVLLNLNYYG